MEARNPPEKLNISAACVQLHGTCLGLEALAIIVSGNGSILTAFDADDNAAPLILTADGQDSDFFGSFPAALLQQAQDQALAMENHNFGEGFFLYIHINYMCSTCTIKCTVHDLQYAGCCFISFSFAAP